MMGKREIYIERGIPCPGPSGPRTDAGRIARTLQIGDSSFTTDRTEMETIRSTLYRAGGKAKVRRLYEGELWGWRVWRLE